MGVPIILNKLSLNELSGRLKLSLDKLSVEEPRGYFKLSQKKRSVEAIGLDMELPGNKRFCFFVVPMREDDYDASKSEPGLIDYESDESESIEESRFERLPIEVLPIISTKLAASVDAAKDFVSFSMTCRTFNTMCDDGMVLLQLSSDVFSIKTHQWCDSALHFFMRCADAGNPEACYWLGMILFYCMEDRTSGLFYLKKAADQLHPFSLFSLAIIQFNGSGRTKMDKNLPLGFALCSCAASLYNVDALRELGHCYQDGYGISMNKFVGQWLLFVANKQELVEYLPSKAPGKSIANLTCLESYYLICDYGLGKGVIAQAHPVNQFLREWWEDKLHSNKHTTKGTSNRDVVIRLCTNMICGRVETRWREFRLCSLCGVVNYCSRACQAIDWRARHKATCISAATFYLLEPDSR